MSRTEPLADDAGLHLLAEHLCSALADGDLEPSILRVELTDDGFELGTLPLDGAHPADLLLGHRAAPGVHAFGVASTGRAFGLDHRDDADRPATPIAMVTILSRTDEFASAVSGLDDVPSPPGRPEGQLIDLLARVLDVPTPPPPASASAFWGADWLAALARHPVPTTFDQALARHPAMQLLAGQHRQDDRRDVIAAFHRVCTWTRLRSIAATKGWEGAGLSASDAAWLDDGSFARLLLGRCAPLPSLRAAALDPMPASVALEVSRFLDALAVPVRMWPDVGTVASCA